MFSTPLYPLFLSLADQRCLIAGFGKVGRRKLAGLLPCGPAHVSIFDPNPAAIADAKLEDNSITFHKRACTLADIRQHSLIFAATNDPAENRHIAEICRQEGKLCNSATEPEAGDFIVPSVVRNDNLCIALSTSGASPLLAALCKQELSQWLTGKTKLTWLLGKLRPLVIARGAESSINADLFKKLLASELPTQLSAGDHDSCKQYLARWLDPQDLDKIFTEFNDAFPS